MDNFMIEGIAIEVFSLKVILLKKDIRGLSLGYLKGILHEAQPPVRIRAQEPFIPGQGLPGPLQVTGSQMRFLREKVDKEFDIILAGLRNHPAV
jgi:hypothetical protein